MRDSGPNKESEEELERFSCQETAVGFPGAEYWAILWPVCQAAGKWQFLPGVISEAHFLPRWGGARQKGRRRSTHKKGPAKRGTATAETREPGRGAGRGRSRGKCRSAGRGGACPRPRKCWHGESSDPSRRRGQGLCVLCQQKEERRPWRLLRLQVQAALGPTDKAQLFEMVC